MFETPIAKSHGADPSVLLDCASFKDPTGSVLVFADHIERTCRPQDVAAFKAFLSSSLYRELEREELIVPAEWIESSGRVRQPRISHWSYPYEWSFSMLQDAARLTLELQQRALNSGYSLKDAAAFNVVFVGAKPVFCDVYSFEQARPRAAWGGYDQFCREMLNPLLLDFELGIDFQPLYRSYLNGIPTSVAAALLPVRTLLHRSAFVHVLLKNTLDRRYASPGRAAPVQSSRDLPDPALARTLQERMVRSLRRAIDRMHPRSSSTWSEYEGTRSYKSDEVDQKKSFVAEALVHMRPRTVIDYGCNAGEFSFLASEHAEHVIAVDADALCIDSLYRRLKQTGSPERIQPLILDLSNPSPSSGWSCRERSSFNDRISADAFLALALVHHLRITANIPTEEFLGYFRRHHAAGVLEYVAPDDPMTRHLMRDRDESLLHDYLPEPFERLLQEHFRIVETRQTMPTRTLYHLSSL